MNGSSLMYRRLALRNRRYPFDDFPRWAKRAVLVAIVRSFDKAVTAGVMFKDENDLSAVLVDGLNEFRRSGVPVQAFDAGLFQVVSRDGCSSTFDGENLQKRPDMIFRLAGATDEHQGWFVECKIVDDRHKPDLYVLNGVDRFISGQYAWAMPSALMLAYAGPGYTIHDVELLSPPCEPSTLLSSPAPCHTEHNRPWTYPGSARRPGDVRLIHLWLHGAEFALQKRQKKRVRQQPRSHA